MGTGNMRGFTVIELMLFLGITGILFAALMVGANNTIVQQRYKESVLDYAAVLQDQYSEVLNTRNDRSNNWKCTNSIVAPEAVGGEFRGRSDCVVLGKAVEIIDGGNAVETTTVVGYYQPVAGVDEPQGDIDVLDAYSPRMPENFDTKTHKLGWGTNLLTVEGEGSTASFLILRSPSSGLLRVFASNEALPTDLREVISPENAVLVVTNCVRGDSGLLPKQSVTVNPSIAGPNGIVINGMDDACA
jgi:type II secretory pathway pseudopilin PulG